MQLEVKVLDEEVCRTCPNLDPVKGTEFMPEGRRYFQIAWECAHLDMCYEIQQSIQKQMDEEE